MDKGFLLFVFLGIFLVTCSYSVLAAESPTNLVFDQNTTASYDKEGNFTINWTAGSTEDQNYVLYIYADDVYFTSATNDSSLAYFFSNTTDANYTFTVEAENATGKANSTNISMIVDTTIPALLYTTNTPTNNTGANRTWIFVNVSSSDTNNDSIVYSLYNSTGLVFQNLTDATTMNWTGLSNNKVYYFNVTANDSATNSNSTSTRTFYLDGTAPSAVTLTSSSFTGTSLTITISATDALSGFGSSCTSSRSGASISGTGTSQTLTETGLSCGSSYSYIVTCSDRASNSKASSATSFLTSGCSGLGNVTPQFWTNTYVGISNEEFKQGVTKQLSEKHRIKMMIDTEAHYVGVVDLTETSAVINISSDPIQVTLNMGEDAKVDTTNDDYYDVYIKLNDIINNKADLTVKLIHEAISEGQKGPVETTGEIIGEKRSLIWLWVLIGIVLVIIIYFWKQEEINKLLKR
jgi:hypothetical protein